MGGAPSHGVEVEDLRISYRRGHEAVEIVRGVSFKVAVGERLALVGESGTGKSLTARSLMGILQAPTYMSGGSVRVGNVDVGSASEAELCRLRGSVASFVPQDPMSALNPVRRIGSVFGEVLTRHCVGLARREREARVARVLDGVGLPHTVLERLPHQLSGGMKQRVLIALALVTEPTVIVADEPTTALDATVQAEILEMLAGQLAERIALVLITHDLGVAATVCGQIAIMYGGMIVERGPTQRILDAPRHPYTEGLLAAAPDFDPSRVSLVPIPGAPPLPGAFPMGCTFGPRCSRFAGDCVRSPRLGQGSEGVACWHPSH